MKRFLALYIGSASPEDKSSAPIPEAVQAEGMAAWGAWIAKHSAAIVDAGGPLGPTKLASPEGVTDARNNITGYVVVQAESLDAAARLFEGHPHFAVFPGAGVEVIELLHLPGS